MFSVVELLLEKLKGDDLFDANVIRWGSPVPSFGDIGRCKIATLGLNPSNREFMDSRGNELLGNSRRFHTLHSLGIAKWADAKHFHIELIVESCRQYFNRNPYDGWFRQLDYLISGVGASYYNRLNNCACHLDLIPFATECKWTSLTLGQRSMLLKASADALGKLLRDSPIQTIILNGRSVVTQFQKMASITFAREEKANWSLRRGSATRIPGQSYSGVVRSLGEIDVGREIQILGFNHNIQSSFGVTTEVRSAIQKWITKQSGS